MPLYGGPRRGPAILPALKLVIPAGLLLGAAMELFMIKTGFYEVGQGWQRDPRRPAPPHIRTYPALPVPWRGIVAGASPQIVTRREAEKMVTDPEYARSRSGTDATWEPKTT